MKRTILIIVIFLLIPAFFAQAELSKKDKYLILSAELGQIDDVKNALNEFRADINARDTNGLTALMWASTKGRTDVVKFLLEKNADVNAKTAQGITALIGASQQGHANIVKLLLDKGADINADGTTAIIGASGTGHTEVVKLLLSKGVNVNAKSSHTAQLPFCGHPKKGTQVL
jgi:ankyrin repeat protein